MKRFANTPAAAFVVGALTACGPVDPAHGVDGSMASDVSSLEAGGDAGNPDAVGDAGGPDVIAWPRTTYVISDGAGLRLADGALVPDGDVRLVSGTSIGLVTPGPQSICVKGMYPSLGQVPTSGDSCIVGGGWIGTWDVLPTTDWLTTMAVGDSLLLRDASHTTAYRVRILDTGVSRTGDWLQIEYAPIP